MHGPLIAEIDRSLAAGQPVAVVTVCSRRGSTPRAAGAKLLVRVDGSTIGTVGGGLVEAEAIDHARQVLDAGPGRASICEFDLTGEQGKAADLLCGGTMELLVDVVSPAERAPYRALLAALDHGLGGLLLTSFVRNEDASDEQVTGPDQRTPSAARQVAATVCGRHLLLDDGQQVGQPLPLGDAVLAPLRRTRLARVFARSDGVQVLVEPLAVPGTIYLFGAGHVSQPVAEIGARTGFRIEVFDDRAEFACSERFPHADRIVVLDAFDQALQDLTLHDDSYVVIVTRGHQHDKTVLARALRSASGYIGMIGSRRKRDTLYRQLLAEGFTQDDLQRVHCPIGIEIGAETPAEIAISIVAELIRHRSRLEARRPR